MPRVEVHSGGRIWMLHKLENGEVLRSVAVDTFSLAEGNSVQHAFTTFQSLAAAMLADHGSLVQAGDTITFTFEEL